VGIPLSYSDRILSGSQNRSPEAHDVIVTEACRALPLWGTGQLKSATSLHKNELAITSSHDGPAQDFRDIKTVANDLEWRDGLGRCQLNRTQVDRVGGAITADDINGRMVGLDQAFLRQLGKVRLCGRLRIL
jgi:hypothetical protein